MKYDDLHELLTNFCNNDYKTYMGEIKSQPKEVVVHYLLYKSLEKSELVTHLEMEHPIIFPIRDEGVQREERKVFVDLLLNQKIPIEVKLRKENHLSDKDFPTSKIIREEKEHLRWVGDHRKLTFLTKDNNSGFCINFSTESPKFFILHYFNGELIKS